MGSGDSNNYAHRPEWHLLKPIVARKERSVFREFSADIVVAPGKRYAPSGLPASSDGGWRLK